ncbi:uncharacterized protein JCM10292_006655 [Rhodotorula paludigena]|uniref:uncharacterized protein n=1 Tax=Rhodotorula paludigena TaxID=86838 RepID=UPI003171F124
MHAALALASLSALATLAVAQTGSPLGYGRFSCSTTDPSTGAIVPDQSLCSNLQYRLTPEELALLQGSQGAGPLPVNAQCVRFQGDGYFCGITSAACTSDANCDNGRCSGSAAAPGTCQGGFEQTCGGNDANCSGFLYCTDEVGGLLPGDTCGGPGAYCQDLAAGNLDGSDQENYEVFNSFCQSGYCAFQPGYCAEHVTTVGGDCSFDPQFACTTDEVTGGQLVPVFIGDPSLNQCECQLNTASPVRARTRRSSFHKRSLCPASHTACSVEGGSGFECIDISNNIEQCGACANDGGVDCTAIAGAEAVGCLAGVCEVWSCQAGLTFDADKGACVASLVV